MTMLALDQSLELFRRSGGTDERYLCHHWPRFVRTREEIERTRPLTAGMKVLDIGAHWLHQTTIYAHEGMQVTALDLPDTLALPSVIAAAAELGITLLCNDSLERIAALQVIADDQFDLVLFTEVIEHITFNPVPMWREIHRVTRPGGRIVVTTPNYYALRGRLWSPRRLLARHGGGLDVSDVVNLRTYAHHWKEYSLRELVHYFRLLSPDFRCIKAACTEESPPVPPQMVRRRVARAIEKRVPILRPSLHVELELATKALGIVVEPHW
jgi:2-polyprenyl-6-hydroxyphenyl methylase/3-demethylubiquinone-9 3-methyltransferase